MYFDCYNFKKYNNFTITNIQLSDLSDEMKNKTESGNLW
ncbi:hypothetical protein SSUR61_0601 [Streptococcus suis R61]|uniref:Uncharacterized protein n=1 Tax=Streptococcus suis R61 TaxID=996306 RepID=A0AA87F9V9_STRSU|nr:hypothetical protein SSUR61_0601 [Streptococcus suis R61]